MNGTRKFLMAVAAGAGALALAWFALIGPLRTDAQAEGDRAKLKAEERARYFPAAGAPIAGVEKALADEKLILEELKNELGRLVLTIPAELEPGDDRDALYFQQQLAKLRSRAESSGVKFDDPGAPFGFSKPPQEDSVAEYLARLEVASRFLEAAKAAGIATIMRAEQPAPEAGPSGGGWRAHELPLKVTAAADEKSLILLLHELSRPERFLALKGLSIKVKDAAAGHFVASIKIAGVTIVEDKESTQPAPGGGGEGAGGEKPKRSFRRYRP